MRGSVYYQTSLLAKLVFASDVKKTQRKDKSSQYYNYVASYKSMETYRKIWNDLGNYLLELYEIKDFEKLESSYVRIFMHEKIFSGISHQYLQKISSAIGKLEFALNRFSKQYNRGMIYDFSCRFAIVKEENKYDLTTDNYRDRAYDYPKQLIEMLGDKKFQLAASIQLSGGARSEGVTMITSKQLQGFKQDAITNKKIGIIVTKEKGGKAGDVYLSVEDYNSLLKIIEEEGSFKINYREYTRAIQNACRILNIKCEGTHGLRWSFAQRRFLEYIEAGYTHSIALQQVSYEMKHMRPDITSHYIGK